MKRVVASVALAAAIFSPTISTAGVVLTSIDPFVLDTIGKSTSGSTAGGIAFINTLSYNVDVFWINYLGNRVFYKNLAAFGSYFQPTYLTHPWIVLTGGTGSIVQGTGTLLDGFLPVTPQPAKPTAATVDYAYIRGAFKTATVPEPMTWVLLIGGIGLAGVALRHRRAAPKVT